MPLYKLNKQCTNSKGKNLQSRKVKIPWCIMIACPDGEKPPYITEWRMFWTCGYYHPLKAAEVRNELTLLRDKTRKQVELEQELPHLQIFQKII